MPTALTVGDWLETWLKTKRIETSSRFGYAAAGKFWTNALRKTELKPPSLDSFISRALGTLQRQLTVIKGGRVFQIPDTTRTG